MNLHDQLHDAAGTPSLDLEHLAREARRQGTTQRRRRLALRTVGGVAAVAALGVGSWSLTGPGTDQDLPVAGDPTSAVPPVASPSAAPGGTAGEQTAPATDVPVLPNDVPMIDGRPTTLTGRITGGLLVDAATQAAASDLTAAEVAGQDPTAPSPETYAQARITTGSGTSTLGVNVQQLSGLPADLGRTCAAVRGAVDCTERTLASGDDVVSYVMDGEKPGQLVRTVNLFSEGRDLRVVTLLTTAAGEPEALEVTALETVVQDPRWGFFPAPDVRSLGADLPAYEDLSSSVD